MAYPNCKSNEVVQSGGFGEPLKCAKLSSGTSGQFTETPKATHVSKDDYVMIYSHQDQQTESASIEQLCPSPMSQNHMPNFALLAIVPFLLGVTMLCRGK